MSHTVTVTRTTHTTSSSAILVNTGYASSVPGLLKLAQVIVGAICVGIVGHYFTYSRGGYYTYLQVPELFFLLIATSCLIASACLLISCLLSLSTAAILPKTLFEIVYHGVAFVLYLAAGITLLVVVSDSQRKPYHYEAYLAAAVLGLINAALYLFSLIFAVRTYRLA